MPTLISAFAATRMAVGLLSWASPPLAARVFGLDPDSEPVVTRLFGARECGLALATAASSGETQKRVLALGVLIDTADLMACAIGMRKGNFSGQAKILTAGGAALFALTGGAALASTKSATSPASLTLEHD